MNICKNCGKGLTKSDVWNDQSESYEFAELGHVPLCKYYNWDFRTKGNSYDRTEPDFKLPKGNWRKDTVQL